MRQPIVDELYVRDERADGRNSEVGVNMNMNLAQNDRRVDTENEAQKLAEAMQKKDQRGNGRVQGIDSRMLSSVEMKIWKPDFS